MLLSLHTRGRLDRQITWRAVPPSLRAGAILVCPADERPALRERYDARVIARPADIHTISAARHWVLETFGPSAGKICFLDDDLRFGVRRADAPDKFLPASFDDVAALFGAMDRALDQYPMVGVCAREGGQRFTQREPIVENQRMMRCWGVRSDFFAAHGIALNAMTLMDDFHAALSVLAAGEPTALLTSWCHDQAGSDAPGGCALYRDAAAQDAESRLLARLHPPFVTVVQKRAKSAGAWAARTDVRIAWAAAAAAGQNGGHP